MRIETWRDEFDSQNLGRNCFKILLSDVGDLSNLSELGSTVDRLTEADMICLSTAHDAHVLAEAHRLGFAFVTTRNVYAARATAERPAPARDESARIGKSELRARYGMPQLEHLVRRLVINSRYWKDERIPRENALKLYESWFHNSVYGDYADEVLAVTGADKIAGVVTLKVREDSAVIDLIVVDDAAQGRGVGTQLVGGAFDYAVARGLAWLRVETEGENVGANRFYQKFGMRLDSHTLAFHHHRTQ